LAPDNLRGFVVYALVYVLCTLLRKAEKPLKYGFCVPYNLPKYLAFFLVLET
jgi:hypothetical protein